MALFEGAEDAWRIAPPPPAEETLSFGTLGTFDRPPPSHARSPTILEAKAHPISAPCSSAAASPIGGGAPESERHPPPRKAKDRRIWKLARAFSMGSRARVRASASPLAVPSKNRPRTPATLGSSPAAVDPERRLPRPGPVVSGEPAWASCRFDGGAWHKRTRRPRRPLCRER